MKEIHLYKMEFYKFRRNTETKELERYTDSFSAYILAQNSREAEAVIHRELGGLCEVFSYIDICKVDRISGEVVSMIIKDNGQAYVKDLMKSSKFAEEQLEKGLQRRIWKNMSVK